MDKVNIKKLLNNLISESHDEALDAEKQIIKICEPIINQIIENADKCKFCVITNILKGESDYYDVKNCKITHIYYSSDNDYITCEFFDPYNDDGYFQFPIVYFDEQKLQKLFIKLNKQRIEGLKSIISLREKQIDEMKMDKQNMENEIELLSMEIIKKCHKYNIRTD